jgi:hypothetical protein
MLTVYRGSPCYNSAQLISSFAHNEEIHQGAVNRAAQEMASLKKNKKHAYRLMVRLNRQLKESGADDKVAWHLASLIYRANAIPNDCGSEKRFLTSLKTLGGKAQKQNSTVITYNQNINSLIDKVECMLDSQEKLSPISYLPTDCFSKILDHTILRELVEHKLKNRGVSKAFDQMVQDLIINLINQKKLNLEDVFSPYAQSTAYLGDNLKKIEHVPKIKPAYFFRLLPLNKPKKNPAKNCQYLQECLGEISASFSHFYASLKGVKSLSISKSYLFLNPTIGRIHGLDYKIDDHTLLQFSKNNPNLKKISINDSQLNVVVVKKILSNFTALQSLKLIINDDKSILPILDLPKLTSLEKLDLHPKDCELNAYFNKLNILSNLKKIRLYLDINEHRSIRYLKQLELPKLCEINLVRLKCSNVFFEHLSTRFAGLNKIVIERAQPNNTIMSSFEKFPVLTELVFSKTNLSHETDDTLLDLLKCIYLKKISFVDSYGTSGDFFDKLRTKIEQEHPEVELCIENTSVS